ncbi:hypothetical protein LINGRAPRIM_LOCUS1175 [Linum grandiflorum]
MDLLRRPSRRIPGPHPLLPSSPQYISQSDGGGGIYGDAGIDLRRNWTDHRTQHLPLLSGSPVSPGLNLHTPLFISISIQLLLRLLPQLAEIHPLRRQLFSPPHRLLPLTRLQHRRRRGRKRRGGADDPPNQIYNRVPLHSGRLCPLRVNPVTNGVNLH